MPIDSANKIESAMRASASTHAMWTGKNVPGSISPDWTAAAADATHVGPDPLGQLDGPMDLFEILVGRINEMVAGFVRVLPQLGIALIVVLITWIIAKTARRLLNRVRTCDGP